MYNAEREATRLYLTELFKILDCISRIEDFSPIIRLRAIDRGYLLKQLVMIDASVQKIREQLRQCAETRPFPEMEDVADD